MLSEIAKNIRVVANYPKEGVVFADVSPIYMNSRQADTVFNDFACRCQMFAPSLIAGIAQRGIPVAERLARCLGLGVITIDKTTSLLKRFTEDDLVTIKYNTEYSADESISLPKNLNLQGQRILIVDDVLATGGTMNAARQLVKEAKGEFAGFAALVQVQACAEAAKACLDDAPLDVMFWLRKDGVIEPVPDFSPAKVYDDLKLCDVNRRARDTRTILLCAPRLASFAMRLVKRDLTTVRLEHITWDRFPDNTDNIRFSDPKVLVDRKVVFLMDTLDRDSLHSQFSLLSALPNNQILSLHVVIPFFAQATMERVEPSNQLASAQTFLKLLGQLDSTQRGRPRIMVYDVHAPIERFYTNSKELLWVEGCSFLDDFFGMIFVTYTPKVVVFPDEGAWKRFAPYFQKNRPNIYLYHCIKKRLGPNEVEIVFNGDPEELKDKRVLVLDDIFNTGKTIATCGKYLKNYVTEISAATIHAVASNCAWTKFTVGGEYHDIFENFFVTDSNPTMGLTLNNAGDPFVLIPVDETLGVDIWRQTEPQTRGYRSDYPMFGTSIISGSKSPLKLDAIIDAFKEVGAHHDFGNMFFAKVDAKSEVSEQPLSIDELKLGAKNRINKCISMYALGSTLGDERRVDTYFIGAESGVILENGVSKEITCCFIQRFGPNRRPGTEFRYEFWTEPLILNKKFYPGMSKVLERMRELKGTETLGSILHKRDAQRFPDPKNWYDRQKYIKDAIVKILKEKMINI